AQPPAHRVVRAVRARGVAFAQQPVHPQARVGPVASWYVDTASAQARRPGRDEHRLDGVASGAQVVETGDDQLATRHAVRDIGVRADRRVAHSAMIGPLSYANTRETASGE